MTQTRTGNITIGFRRMGGWQSDLDAVIKWAVENNFGAIDIGADAAEIGQKVLDAGLRIGSVDQIEWQGLISADPDKRKDAVAHCKEYIETCGHRLGATNYFIVMIPENQDLPRRENFGYMVESYGELAPTLEQHGGKVVIEGWPGPGALCCTPETLRAFFKEVPSMSMGVNYDPSHLIRMGIDPIRFLKEFASRVYHVHGKDTERLPERLYEYGNLQPAAFSEPFFCGEQVWRYTIPGHGEMRWVEAFQILKDAGYKGCVSIELEDCNFNGTEEGEKLGFVSGRKFLEGC